MFFIIKQKYNSFFFYFYSRIEKAKTKYLAYVELKNEWGDCSLEVVAPFLATGAQMLPPWAVDNEGRQVI